MWFAHPLLASTLIDLHTDAERRFIHARLASMLDDPDEQAMHLARGTHVPMEAVAAELEQAARHLDLRGAPENAAFLAERAAEPTPDSAGDTTRRRILAADLYQAAGEGSAHVLPLLERLNETLQPGPDHARVLLRVGWLGAMMDTLSTPEVVALLQQALTEAGDTPHATAAAHGALARLLGNGGDYLVGASTCLTRGRRGGPDRGESHVSVTVRRARNGDVLLREGLRRAAFRARDRARVGAFARR